MQAIKRLIPNLLTAGNLVGGIFAIIFTLTGKIELAPYCIFASAIFDFLDGFAARLLKVQNEIGKQLDSLADMVTFGVAPGVMMYVVLNGMTDNIYLTTSSSNEQIGSLVALNAGSDSFFEDMIPYITFLIPICALFRLAKFNLDTRQTDSFIGLPTPAMTLFFAVMPLLIKQAIIFELAWQVEVGKFITNPIFLVPAIIIMSILMVSEIPLFSLKFKTFMFKGNEIRFIFLTICVVLLATLFLWSIPLIIILYIILSLINNAIKPKHEV